MTAAGLPEIEVRDVPAFLAEAAGTLVNRVCDYMLSTGEPVSSGQTMRISPGAQIKFVTAEPMPGKEDHYDHERLQIVDFEARCVGCGRRHRAGGS
jgi:hypothetical protein